MRRILLIFAILFIFGLIAGGLYFIFFSGPSGVTVAPGGSPSLPVAGQGTGSTGTAVSASSTSPAFNNSVSVSARLVQISAGPVVPGEAVVDIRGTSSSTPTETTVRY